MVDIVGIHGVGWHDSSRDDMLESWRGHLARGLKDVRSARHSDFTLEAAFYGSRYNVVPCKKGVALDHELAEGFEVDFLTEMTEAVDDTGQLTDRKMYLPGSVQWLVRRLESTSFFTNAGQYALIRFIKQVGRYFADAELRMAAQEEFLKAVGSGANVVVAHSLGSVIAYDVLREEPSVKMNTLITVGSPLGLRVIRERLGVGLDKAGQRPAGVGRWVNVAASEDAVATVKTLGDHYVDVEDKQIRNSRIKAHAAVRYLAAVPTSEAIRLAIG